jgi:putative transposase
VSFGTKKDNRREEMPRKTRHLVSQDRGAYHIYSKVAGGEILFFQKEKEYFMNLLKRFALGFFVQIHAFTVMGNHFHLLATILEKEAALAGKEELYARYKLMYGSNAEPPCGSFDDGYGDELPDADGGVERLRKRLGSLSRFVQELKQSFSRWYNKENNRKGYLWGERFKSVIVEKNEILLGCSAYIDLNSVRANLVKRPEDYRWCSLGMRVREPLCAGKTLTLIPIKELLSKSYMTDKYDTSKTLSAMRELKSNDDFEWYREFVYIAGGIERERKARIPESLINSVISFHGKLNIGDRLRYRVKNFSEGIAVGSFTLIENFQIELRRKIIRPRPLMKGNWCYTTRVYRS